MRSQFRQIPSSIVWILFFYSLGLWYYSVPLTGDEKVYASISMEMWGQKSWLYPILFGEHSYFKPPFQYWATLTGWSLFGYGNFGAYFPPALAVATTAWFIYLIQELLTPQRDGTPKNEWTASLWFAGCFGTLTYGATLQMEIWIVFFYTAVWWAFLKFYFSKCWKYLYLALILAGISGLVKSPLYSCFSVIGIWMFIVFQKQWVLFRSLHFYLSHLAGIFIGLSWYVAVFFLDYDRFWSHYVGTETLSKTSGNGATLGHMWMDFSTFIVPFLLLLLPVFIQSFGQSIGQPIRQALKQSPRVSFIVASALLPAFFFSSFPYRTETYLYILVPTLTLVLDWGILAGLKLRKEKGSQLQWMLRIVRINGAFVFALGLIVSAVLTFGQVTPVWIGFLILLSCFGFLVFSFRVGKRENVRYSAWKQLAFSSLMIITVVRLGAITLGESDIRTLKDFVKTHPDRTLTFYDEGKNIWHEAGLLSIAVGKVSKRVYSIQEAVDAIVHQEAVVISNAFLEDASWNDSFMNAIKNSSALPELKNKSIQIIPWKRWKRGFAIPTLQDLKKLGNRNSPEWEAKNQREFKIVLVSN